MEKRTLGPSNLEVSAVGSAATTSAAAPISRPPARSCIERSISASPCSTPPTSMATRASPRSFSAKFCKTGARTSCWPPSSACRWRQRRPRDASRRLCHAGGGGEPEAAPHRLDRSLSGAPARSEDADRGDPARARRSGAAGQGARRSAARTFPRRKWTTRRTPRRAEVCVVRHRPGRIQPAGPRHRTRADPGDGAAALEPAALLSAGERPPDRQIPARRTAPEGRAAVLQRPPVPMS